MVLKLRIKRSAGAVPEQPAAKRRAVALPVRAARQPVAKRTRGAVAAVAAVAPPPAAVALPMGGDGDRRARRAPPARRVPAGARGAVADLPELQNVHLYYAEVQSGKGRFIAQEVSRVLAAGGRALVVSMNSRGNGMQVQQRLTAQGVPVINVSQPVTLRKVRSWQQGETRALSALFNAKSLEGVSELLSLAGDAETADDARRPVTVLVDEGDFLLEAHNTGSLKRLIQVLTDAVVQKIWVVTATPVAFYVPSPLLPEGIRGDRVVVGEAPANYRGIKDLITAGTVPDETHLAVKAGQVADNDEAFYETLLQWKLQEATPELKADGHPLVLYYNGAMTNAGQDAVAERVTKMGLVALVANQEKPKLSGPAARAAGLSKAQGTLVTCGAHKDFRTVWTALLNCGQPLTHLVIIAFNAGKRSTNFTSSDYRCALTHQYLVSARAGCWESHAQSLRSLGIKSDAAVGFGVQLWASAAVLEGLQAGWEAARDICRAAQAGGAACSTVLAAAAHAEQSDALSVRYGRYVSRDIAATAAKRLKTASSLNKNS